jgi:cell division septal protein FtsQ
MEQTSFIKKRKNISFSIFDFNKIKFLWNNSIHYYFLIFFIFIASILYIFLWPTFKIKYIEIIKQDNITNMTIAYKATDKYRWKSIFNIENKEILNRLKDYQYNIKNVDINIDLPNTLKINISSYKWLFNTTINNKSYIITENGTLVPANYSESLKELKIIKQFDKNKFIDYKKILDSRFINKISQIVNKIKENIIEINIKELKYYITERELHIKTDNDTLLIFNIDSNIKEQIEKISIFNKEHKNIEKNNIIYIDLRIKNKVFYCTSEKEYQCYKNLKSVYPKE